MNELLRALRVAQTSTRRFRTLRATVRDWDNLGLIAKANPRIELSDETVEKKLRLWFELDGFPKQALWRDERPVRARIEDERSAERGVLLRAESRFQGETMAVEEMLEVAFDEDLPDELFEVPA